MRFDVQQTVEPVNSKARSYEKAMMLRKETGISIDVIAEIAGVAAEEYSLYEAGRKDLPASALYLVSTLLAGEPLALFDGISR